MAAIMKHDMKAILGEDFFKEEIHEGRVRVESKNRSLRSSGERENR